MQVQPLGASLGAWAAVGVTAHHPPPQQLHSQQQQQQQQVARGLGPADPSKTHNVVSLAAAAGQPGAFLNPGVANARRRQDWGHAQQLPVTLMEMRSPPTRGEQQSGEPGSPGSLCSTIALQPMVNGSETKGSGAWASEFQESLARLSSRVDTALADLQAELARLRGQGERERAAGAEKLEVLELGVGTAKEESAACSIRVQVLERDLAELKGVGAAQAEALERGLAREAEARAELERALGKDLREQIATDAERVHSAVMREMRERIDGQKSLRDEVQFQQQSMTRLTSRVDEVFVELRAELPRLRQEHACQRADVEKLQVQQSAIQARVEGAEQGIVEEAERRGRSERQLGEDLRKLITADMTHARTQTAELLQRLDELGADASAVGAKAAQVEEGLRQCGVELKSVREDATQEVADLRRRTAESEADVRGLLDTRLLESEAGLRIWVTSSVLARLAALEGAARPQVQELVMGQRTVREERRTPVPVMRAPVQMPANWVAQGRPVTTFITPG